MSDGQINPDVPQPVRKRNWRRIGIVLLLFAIIVFAGVESFARFGLHLGNPPLSTPHPTIEYMFAPNQDCNRFGNRILINEFGMRSGSVTKMRQTDEELRILVLGDSVINGGNLTDHADLATTLLEQRLEKELSRPVFVGNISAGSWGPPNLLAYVQEFGTFDAEIVVLVLSSHDYADAPTFDPLNPDTHPTHRPICATWEGVTRYLPRYLPSLSSPAKEEHKSEPSAAAMEQCRTALDQLIAVLKSKQIHVIVVQHWTREELQVGNADPGHGEIRQIAMSHEVPVLETNERLRSIGDGEFAGYRDDVHVNVLGQRALAEVFETAVKSVLSDTIHPK